MKSTANLTIERVEDAVCNLPDHRADLCYRAKSILRNVEARNHSKRISARVDSD